MLAARLWLAKIRSGWCPFPLPFSSTVLLSLLNSVTFSLIVYPFYVYPTHVKGALGSIKLDLEFLITIVLVRNYADKIQE
jgi:hypothetical protein